jgi:hypothetical protein
VDNQAVLSEFLLEETPTTLLRTRTKQQESAVADSNFEVIDTTAYTNIRLHYCLQLCQVSTISRGDNGDWWLLMELVTPRRS